MSPLLDEPLSSQYGRFEVSRLSLLFWFQGAFVGHEARPETKHEAAQVGRAVGQLVENCEGQAVGQPEPEGEVISADVGLGMQEDVAVELPELVAVPLLLETNGFTLSPPFALAMFHVKGDALSCLLMLAERSSVFIESPDLYAYIQALEEPVKSILPPDQLLQLLHRTLAIILPFVTPDPASNSTWASVSC